VDEKYNVCGRIPGAGQTGKSVLIEGHLDTVFPFGTVKEVVEKDGKLYAPGISDDTRALAAKLTVARAFAAYELRPWHDVIIAGTAAEEGLGAMSGMRRLVSARAGELLAAISIDGPSADIMYYNATGIINYDVTYSGPGGHAYLAFGTPSAVQAMGRAIAILSDLPAPAVPRTTFTVSLAEGGQAIHAIAQKANFKINMRSDDPAVLAELEQRAITAFRQGARQENDRWGKTSDVSVTFTKITDVPAGNQPQDCLIVQAAKLATLSCGVTPQLRPGGCTNSNMPIGLGIPAVTLGRGGTEYGTHTVDEWFDPAGVYVCEQKSLLLLLALAGLAGVTEPPQL
jgi:acetylornithine deacetylase/succinyl-diaminopimelate desuccinylase-like protein